MNNELLNFVEVIETCDVEKLNELLSKGWKLFATCTKLAYFDHPEHQSTCYSVGRLSK